MKRKWIKWLKHDLLMEIRYLQRLKTVYREINRIFENWQDRPKNNEFYWYRNQTHTAAVIAGVYRLTDKRPDITSLYKLLEEVKNNLRLISRQSYTRLPKRFYINSLARINRKRRLNNAFTSHAGKGAYIDTSIVCRDIEKITKLSKKICNFRNKFIGHHAYNQRVYKVTLTLREVHDCIDVLDSIYKKYFLLITGGSMDTTIRTTEISSDLAMIFKNAPQIDVWI